MDGHYEILPYAATYVWTGARGSSWDDQGDWKDGQVPNIINASVTFGNEALDSSTVAVLTADRTVGDLKFSGTRTSSLKLGAPQAASLWCWPRRRNPDLTPGLK